MSPVTVNTTPTTIAPSNTSRQTIRFQNTGETTIYLKKNTINSTLVTNTDYEVLLLPTTKDLEGGEAFTTTSMHSFSAISSTSNGKLAVFETAII